MRNTVEYLIYYFTDLGKNPHCPIAFSLRCIQNVWDRVHHILEIKAYVKGRRQLGIYSLNIKNAKNYCKAIDIKAFDSKFTNNETLVNHFERKTDNAHAFLNQHGQSRKICMQFSFIITV